MCVCLFAISLCSYNAAARLLASRAAQCDAELAAGVRARGATTAPAQASKGVEQAIEPPEKEYAPRVSATPLQAHRSARFDVLGVEADSNDTSAAPSIDKNQALEAALVLAEQRRKRAEASQERAAEGGEDGSNGIASEAADADLR